MSREGRRRRGVFARIVDDPYRKLVAIGLAVLLWFFINSRIMDSTSRELQLAVVDLQQPADDIENLEILLDNDHVVKRRFLHGDREIDSVTVRLTGPRYRIDALESERLNLAVRSFVEYDWSRGSGDEPGQGSNLDVLEFTARDIRGDSRAFADVEIEMIPAKVRVEVEVLDMIVVPLQVDAVEIGGTAELKSRVRIETAAFTPDKATLYGPAINMAKLKGRQKLFRAELQATGGDREAVANLTIIDPQLQIRFKQVPLMQVQLQPRRHSRTLELPVVVDDVSLVKEQRGAFVPEIERMAVKVSFSGKLGTEISVMGEGVQSWAEENLRLQVYIRRPPPGESLRDPLQLKPYLVLAGTQMQTYERSEYLLEDHLTVTLRRKP